MGMGVPICCILFGFPLGWYLANRISASPENFKIQYRWILKWSSLAAGFTFLLMLAIWGRMIFLLFDPSFDFGNFGHPFILFEPKASFIGWGLLMIVISPFLQLLATLSASFATFAIKEGIKSADK
jgi:hypothetical protein